MKIVAVVLAAGGSTRLGHPKQLLKLDGRTLVARAAMAAHIAGAHRVIVVTGAVAEQVEAAVAHLDFVTTKFNSIWMDGLASSVRSGLAALVGEDFDGVLMMVCDQPAIDSEILKKLVEQFDSENRIVAAAYDGTIGVPALFGKEFIPELVQLKGDEGAGRWLRKHEKRVTRIDAGEAATDIDTRDDATRLGASGVGPHFNGR